MSYGSFSGRTKADSKGTRKIVCVLSAVFEEHHKKLDQLQLKIFQIFNLLKLVIQI
jgi:hypothetical protein